jgi:hypothetical protein
MENLDELKSYLRPHTYNNCIDDRDEHLRALFEHGAWIKSLIRSHPAEWSFGDISVWPTDSTQAVAFPSISKRGLIVREQELVSL